MLPFGNGNNGFDMSVFMSQANMVKMIPIDMLKYNNEYERYEGDRFDDMVSSIKNHGILSPLIVHADDDGKYEILAGNNRRYCGEAAGLTSFPCFVKENLTDEEKQAYIDETNVFQRGFTNLKISKQAEVIARRHSQMFNKEKLAEIQKEIAYLGGSHENEINENGVENSSEKKATKYKLVGDEYGLGRTSVSRLIRINTLIPELKKLLDENVIALRVGVDLSFLSENEQQTVYRIVSENKLAVDMKKSALLKTLADERKLTDAIILSIISGEYSKKKKAASPKAVKVNATTVKKYFKSDWDNKKIQEVIETALDEYFKNHKD